MLAVLKPLSESGSHCAAASGGRSTTRAAPATPAPMRSSTPSPHEATARFGIIQIDSGGAITLGNRGRVDVDVHIRGRVAHSSQPDDGLSAIEGAAEVVQRLRALAWNDSHPLLGGRHAVVYKVRYEPVAPHTLPSDAYMAIDRRLLPGDDPADSRRRGARRHRRSLALRSISVTQGVTMLPALVDPAYPGVHALAAAHASVHGSEPDTGVSARLVRCRRPLCPWRPDRHVRSRRRRRADWRGLRADFAGGR